MAGALLVRVAFEVGGCLSMPIGSAVADSGIAVRTSGRVTALSSCLTRQFAGVVLIVGALAWLYADVLIALIRQWGTDDNYSHGFLVPLFAAYFVWERRRSLAAARPQPTVIGAAVVALGLGLFLGGVFAARTLPDTRFAALPARGRRPVRLGSDSSQAREFSHRVPSPDDSAAGDPLQSDRVSASADRITSRRGDDRGRRHTGAARRQHSSIRRARPWRSPRPAAAYGR